MSVPTVAQVRRYLGEVLLRDRLRRVQVAVRLASRAQLTRGYFPTKTARSPHDLAPFLPYRAHMAKAHLTTITSWNLLHGEQIPPLSGANTGANTPFDLTEKHLGIIASKITSDVVGLQEVDAFQTRSGGVEQVKFLAKEMGAKHFKFARTVIGTPGESWRKVGHDEEILNPKDKNPSYGIGLISRIPVKKWHTLPLGRSLVGLPLAIPGVKKNGKAGVKFIYVKDEPRIALAAELENGLTVAVTHLSFVPLFNLYQLWRVKRWLAALPGEHVLIGDLNLAWNLPVKTFLLKRRSWKSLAKKATYPSWKAKIQFDYILSNSKKIQASSAEISSEIGKGRTYSDHLPISVAIKH